VAYKTASGEALTAATIEERFVMREFTASIPYAEVDKVMRTIRATEAEVINREYTVTHTQFTIRCRLSREQELKEKIGVPPEEAQ
jgi:putative IMPACT (imprinted ancient) family translation regulator